MYTLTLSFLLLLLLLGSAVSQDESCDLAIEGPRIESENYISAMDSSLGNSGNSLTFTPFDVDLEKGDGDNLIIGYVTAGEWLQYSIYVPKYAADQDFALSMHYSSKKCESCAAVLSINDEVIGKIALPKTGSYDIYTDAYTTSFKLPVDGSSSECLKLKIEFLVDQGINFDYFNLLPAEELPVVVGMQPVVEENEQQSCGSSFMSVNSPIQAEDVTRALDNEMENKYTGEVETKDGFDLKIHDAFDGGKAVGFTKSGEWLEYDLVFPSAGFWQVEIYYGAGKLDVSKAILYMNGLKLSEIGLVNTSSDLIVGSVISEPFFVDEPCSSFRIEWIDGKVDFDKMQFSLVVEQDNENSVEPTSLIPSTTRSVATDSGGAVIEQDLTATIPITTTTTSTEGLTTSTIPIITSTSTASATITITTAATDAAIATTRTATTTDTTTTTLLSSTPTTEEPEEPGLLDQPLFVSSSQIVALKAFNLLLLVGTAVLLL